VDFFPVETRAPSDNVFWPSSCPFCSMNLLPLRAAAYHSRRADSLTQNTDSLWSKRTGRKDRCSRPKIGSASRSAGRRPKARGAAPVETREAQRRHG